jgi:hypothetical protein
MFIQASDRQRNARFGTSIAVNSNAQYIMVSTPNINRGSLPVLTDIGAVYVYKKNNITDFWRPIYNFRPTDSVAFDFFGASMSMTWDANYLVVSSPDKNVINSGGTTISDAGTVYIYKKSPTTDFWQYLQQVTMINPVQNARFGTTVEITRDATYFFAGTAGATIDTRMTTVFKKDPTTDYWTEVTRFCGQSSLAGTGSNFTISSNGEYVLQNAVLGSGRPSTFMFKKDLGTDNWSLIQTISGNDDMYAPCLSPDGSNVIIGYADSNNGVGLNSGISFLYKKLTTTDYWVYNTSIIPSRNETSNRFGYTNRFVADGSIALIAAPYQSSITAPGVPRAGIIWAFGFATSKEIPSTSQYVVSTPPLTGRMDFTLPPASSTRYPILYYKTTPDYTGQQALRFQTQAGETIDGGASILGYSYHASYSFANDGLSKWYTLMSYGESS